MPTVFVMRRCARCGRPTQHIGQRPNHVLHLLLSLVTVGLWLIVWLFVAAGTSQWLQCSECGEARK